MSVSGAALAAESAVAVVVAVAESVLGAAAASTPLLLQEVVIAAAMTRTANNCFIGSVFLFKKLGPAKLLFFPKEKPDGHSLEIKVLSQLVLKIVLIGLLYVVGEVAKEGERRNDGGQLRDVFYF